MSGGLPRQSAPDVRSREPRGALAEAGASGAIGRLPRSGEIAAAIVFLCSERCLLRSRRRLFRLDAAPFQVII